MTSFLAAMIAFSVGFSFYLSHGFSHFFIGSCFGLLKCRYSLGFIFDPVLGISELKWTGMGEFNSHDHNSYYCGQESLRRNGVAFMVNKRV